MADETKTIFTKKASDKLRSPDDLDVYVRVTNPSVWVMLVACAALVAGVFAWGFFGTIETNVSAVGTCIEGKPVCFLPVEKAANVHVGDPSNVGSELMEVESMSAVPISRVEAREIVGGDYLASTLVTSEWSYVVRFGGASDYDFAEGVPLDVKITTDRIAPISALLRKCRIITAYVWRTRAAHPPVVVGRRTPSTSPSSARRLRSRGSRQPYPVIIRHFLRDAV